MDTSVIQGADLWLAVACGFGLLLVGVGLGIIVSHYLKKVNQQRLEEEAEAREAELSELELRLRRLMLPKDPNDHKNVIIEIRAGTGGNEAALFASDLYRM